MTRRRYHQLVHTLGAIEMRRWLLEGFGDIYSPALQREVKRLKRTRNHIAARLNQAIAYGFQEAV